jgi:phage shock protein C
MERRLYRSQRNRVFLGICGGFGEYFNVDPVIIRIIAVLLTIASGFFPGLIAYFILALIIPTEESTSNIPGGTFRENIADMKDSSARLSEDIRHSFTAPRDGTINDRESHPVNPTTQTRLDSNRSLYILGLILVGIGAFFLATITFNWLWRYLWPALLIIVGVVIIVIVFSRRK